MNIKPPTENELSFTVTGRISASLEKLVEIEFDGGSSCNIPRLGFGIGYGSYRVDKGVIVRCKFGNMSANAAEVLTLCEAVKSVGINPQTTRLKIYGDSMIALNKAKFCNRKPKKINGSPEFQEACFKLRTLLQQFQSVETIWRGRDHSVRIFGH